MIIKLSATTGEVLEVKDSPGVPFKKLADEFAWRTKKIWKAEAEKAISQRRQKHAENDT